LKLEYWEGGMARTTKVSEIGFRQAKRLCGMSAKARLDFIAEGLPIIHASARSLLEASRTLEGFTREAAILQGQAIEECAKALILVDLVRCPAKAVAQRIGPMMGWFYDHLARLLYAEAQFYKPMTIDQLRGYVDNDRPSHYLDGEFSEYIMPNSVIFRREGSLYADVVGVEDAEPAWHSPFSDWRISISFDPAAWSVIDALEAFGLLSRPGLGVMAKVWGKVYFDGDVDCEMARALCGEMIEGARSAGLVTERASVEHLRSLHNTWQAPMYALEFSSIAMSLEELQQRREASFPWEY